MTACFEHKALFEDGERSMQLYLDCDAACFTTTGLNDLLCYCVTTPGDAARDAPRGGQAGWGWR
eukprot:8489254-Pyramimonas_sp.AAC.1